MEQSNLNPTTGQTVSLPMALVIGGAIGFAIISFFVFGVDNPSPDWGPNWRIRPLIVTPIAGAMGGAFYFVMDYLCTRGLNRTVAVILSLVVFIISLWLGTVLGLVGTMWN